MAITDESTITLTSADGVKVEIPVKAAKNSKFLANTLSIREEDDDDDETAAPPGMDIPLPNVDGETLKMIVDYLKHYVDHPFPAMPEIFEGLTFKENIADEYYTEFMQKLVGDYSDRDLDLLYQIKGAANYMDITSLLEMICLWMTFKIQELKDGKKIRELLRLEYSKEEEADIKDKHPWLFVTSGKDTESES